MEEQFWKDAWTNRRIGFHMPEYNKFLEHFITNSKIDKSQVALVPLCGKTLDMIYLRDQGFKVVGIEIATQATEEFFSENKIEHTIREAGEYTIYESNSLTIICGDILNVTSELTGNIGFIYDRAATVALPPAMRAQYFSKLKELSQEKTELLLITGHSLVEDLIGPPFSVPKEEIELAYKPTSSHFEILNEKKGRINSSRLRDQGITERVMVAHHIKF